MNVSRLKVTKNMNARFLKILAAAACLMGASSAQASLIGQTVGCATASAWFDYCGPTSNNVVRNPGDEFTIVGSTSGTLFPTPFSWTVDFGPTYVRLEWVDPPMGPTPSIGFAAESAWIYLRGLTGVTGISSVSSDVRNFGSGNVTFYTDRLIFGQPGPFIEFDLGRTYWGTWGSDPGRYVQVDFTFDTDTGGAGGGSDTTVPEPGTGLLLLSGLAGLRLSQFRPRISRARGGTPPRW